MTTPSSTSTGLRFWAALLPNLCRLCLKAELREKKLCSALTESFFKLERTSTSARASRCTSGSTSGEGCYGERRGHAAAEDPTRPDTLRGRLNVEAPRERGFDVAGL